jgi:hypothetical protein
LRYSLATRLTHSSLDELLDGVPHLEPTLHTVPETDGKHSEFRKFVWIHQQNAESTLENPGKQETLGL